MSNPKPLQAAVIGCGFVGRLHAQAIHRSGHARLVAVCDVDPRRAASVADEVQAEAYTSLEQLFQSTTGLDIVTVATPDDLHVEPVTAALQRGLHVFCEKPLAGAVSQAERLEQLARSAGVHLGVNYNRRFAFGYQQAHRILAAAANVPIRQLDIHVTDGIPQAVANQPFALLTTLVSHHLDLLRWYAGEIAWVQAALHGSDPERPQQLALFCQSVRGTLGCITALWRRDQSRTSERLQLVTDHQVITVDDVLREVSVWTSDPDQRQTYRPSTFQSGGAFYDTIAAHIDAFLAAIAGDIPPPIVAADGCAALRLITAAIDSHQTGRRIHLDDNLLSASSLESR